MSRDNPVHTLLNDAMFEAMEKLRKEHEVSRGQWIRGAIEFRLAYPAVRIVDLPPGVSVFIRPTE